MGTCMDEATKLHIYVYKDEMQRCGDFEMQRSKDWEVCVCI